MTNYYKTFNTFPYKMNHTIFARYLLSQGSSSQCVITIFFIYEIQTVLMCNALHADSKMNLHNYFLFSAVPNEWLVGSLRL